MLEIIRHEVLQQEDGRTRLSSLRVAKDVELGRLGNVSPGIRTGAESTAHDRKNLNVLCNLRESCKQQRNVGEGSGSYESSSVGRSSHQGIAHGENGALRGRICRDGDLGKEVRSIDTRLSVNIRSVDSRAHEGLGSTSIYGDVGLADGSQDRVRVDGNILERGVSVYGGEPEEVEGRVLSGEDDSKGILKNKVSSCRMPSS